MTNHYRIYQYQMDLSPFLHPKKGEWVVQELRSTNWINIDGPFLYEEDARTRMKEIIENTNQGKSVNPNQEASMWKITIRLCFPSMTGWAALDVRRRLGLSDSSELKPSQNQIRCLKTITVDEDFARQYLRPTSLIEQRTISLDQLRSGDIEGEEWIGWYLDLHPDRVRDLWIGGKE